MSDTLSRREFTRIAVLTVALIAAIIWSGWHFLQNATPRRFVLASGAADGMYHQHALRYKQILAREGVTVEERMTSGASDNLRLLLDPKSGVDVALVQGGVAQPPEASNLVMLASIGYEPVWIFYRGPDTLTQINELRGKRIAIGIPGSGTRTLAESLFEANGVTRNNTNLRPLSNIAALRALQDGDIDAALFVGPVQTPAIWQALHDTSIECMSNERADAYPRRYAYISELTLPQGSVDLGLNIPPQKIHLIATKAMLVAREDFPPALINLLLDAAREVHSGQGYFETAGEFPATTPVDIPVSEDADRHLRFGPSFLHRYLPFWVATFIERFIILVVPLIVLLIPLLSYLPQVVRWRVRSRIYRWYGELKLLERDVAAGKTPLPIEKWLQRLDRIDHAVEHIKTPASFASEAYILREHIALVRRVVLAKAAAAGGGIPRTDIGGP